MSDIKNEKDRLRKHLNPLIKGKNTEAILEALAPASLHLIDNAEAIYDSLFIVSAKERYLVSRIAEKGLVVPENVGISDEVLRDLAIEVTNRKQVRELILSILETMFGPELTRATSISNKFEPYFLEDGDSLILQFDDSPETAEVVFKSSQFQNINAATAQEVSDAITKEMRKLGKSGSAFAADNGSGGFVTLISNISSPASSVKVLGGKAQNKLVFDTIRPTTVDASTQLTLTQQPNGSIRATWTGGSDPSFGKVRKGDYVNIYGTSFDISNRGTFEVLDSKGGSIGNSFVEISNPNGISEIVVAGNTESMLFYFASRKIIQSKMTFASAFQTEARLIEVIIPAATKVVRRNRTGAAYLQEEGIASTNGDFGPYIYDTQSGYLIDEKECFLDQKVDASTELLISVDDSSNFPDSQGNLIFGFGTEFEEGPVPYISRPSSSSLLISPTYRFKNVHEIGTNISNVAKIGAFDPALDGSDFPFYLTDVVSGRIFAEDLIKMVSATGIRLVITVLYPDDTGLGKFGTDSTEIKDIYGQDPE